MYTEFTGNPHQDRKGPLYGGGRWINPNFPNEQKSYDPHSAERYWNPNFPNEQKSFNDSWLQLLNTGADQSMRGPLNPSGIQLAELTQKQMDYMGSPYNTPDFRKKEDLWDRTKGMEKKGFFGWGAQEPTTRQEFDDYYNQLQQGKAGNWVT